MRSTDLVSRGGGERWLRPLQRLYGAQLTCRTRVYLRQQAGQPRRHGPAVTTLQRRVHPQLAGQAQLDGPAGAGRKLAPLCVAS